jgi:hypothetical protein
LPEAKLKTITWDIDRTIGGKKLPPAYDWKLDPDKISNEGHIPPNRCYHCGYRFVGAKLAAFCVVCDMAMTIDKDPRHFELVATRIRIPEDITDEKSYQDKMSIPDVSEAMKPGFFRADQLV